MVITNKTQLNAVIGYPLAHSKSPVLHQKLYQILQCDAVLLAFEEKNLAALIESIRTLKMGLVAVTMPFKEKILPYLDEFCPAVNALKAANTIINHNGKLKGYNTDVEGIAFALKNISISNKNVLIIGAGGAARAAAYFFKKHFAKLFWYNRSKQNILRMQDEFGGKIIPDVHDVKDKIDIIVNATPLGMPPHFVTPLPQFSFHAGQIVFDMVYDPIETKLLSDAKKQGAAIISGLSMFIGQGIRQIELWTEKKISFEEIEMRLIKGLV